MNETELISNEDDRIFGDPTILIVDDDLSVREVLEFSLQYMGCKTISAVNGNLAIEMYKECWESIDLVILDFFMPGMNGEETFIELSKHNQALRCLFSSGNGGEITSQLLQHNLNQVGFLQKPYDLNMLRDRINQILSN